MAEEELISQVMGVSPEEQARFTVIGSGIIGVLTAKALAEQGHDVTVLSGQGKPVSLDTSSVSTIAIGQFLPWVPEAHQESLLGDLSLREVTDYSKAFYGELANNPHETGVMSIPNLELVSSKSPWPSGLLDVMAAKQEGLTQPIGLIGPNLEEVVFDTAITFDTFSINTRKTVAFLADRAEDLGVKFLKRKVEHRDLQELDGIIVNATGAGAQSLDPTAKINEFKGHTFVVKPKEGHNLPSEALSIEDIVMMPREDGTAICGALYIENPDQPIPEEKEADELFKRLRDTFRKTADMVDGLEPDFLDNVDILFHSAGYRVEVEGSGIRVAPDAHNQRLLHAYGFGGLGWSVGPHFAKRIAAMANDMRESQRQ